MDSIDSPNKLAFNGNIHELQVLIMINPILLNQTYDTFITSSNEMINSLYEVKYLDFKRRLPHTPNVIRFILKKIYSRLNKLSIEDKYLIWNEFNDCSLLHYAVVGNQYETVKRLLQLQINLNIMNNSQRIAEFYALTDDMRQLLSNKIQMTLKYEKIHGNTDVRENKKLKLTDNVITAYKQSIKLEKVSKSMLLRRKKKNLSVNSCNINSEYHIIQDSDDTSDTSHSVSGESCVEISKQLKSKPISPERFKYVKKASNISEHFNIEDIHRTVYSNDTYETLDPVIRRMVESSSLPIHGQKSDNSSNLNRFDDSLHSRSSASLKSEGDDVQNHDEFDENELRLDEINKRLNDESRSFSRRQSMSKPNTTIRSIQSNDKNDSMNRVTHSQSIRNSLFKVFDDISVTENKQQADSYANLYPSLTKQEMTWKSIRTPSRIRDLLKGKQERKASIKDIQSGVAGNSSINPSQIPSRNKLIRESIVEDLRDSNSRTRQMSTVSAAASNSESEYSICKDSASRNTRSRPKNIKEIYANMKSLNSNYQTNAR